MTVSDRHFRTFILDNPLRRLFSSPRKVVSKYASKGNVVADIGCGPGYFTLAFAEVVGPTGRVYAVDSDSKSIEILSSKAAKRGYAGGIEAHVSSAADLSFIPDSSVDFVFAKGLICCMLDHSGAVREIRRIMKSDALAYMSVSSMRKRRDPRSVGREEWDTTIGQFGVVKRGRGLTARWAVVSKKKPLDRQEERALHLASAITMAK